MNRDLENRILSARAILDNLTFQKYKKVIETLKIFDGLCLSEISNAEKTTLENSFKNINNFVTKYKIENFEDYKKIKSDELDEMIYTLKSMINFLEM